ncbi:MAG TPA: cupredoxin domain-containing protein [Myxococcales bacterium]|nr:cupredoxin domain-containing protein [Myxococcales bacterium]
MTSTHLCSALLAGVLAISCRQQAQKPVKSDAPQVKEVTVTAKGFEPDRIEVAPGQQVLLRITRKEADTCADAIDVQGDPVRHMLPLDKAVDVKLTAPQSGEIAFACPMKMVHGAIVVIR